MKKLIIIPALLIAIAVSAQLNRFSTKTGAIQLNIEPTPATIKWLSPSGDNLVSSAKRLKLEFVVESESNVSKVSVYNNEEQVQMSRGMGTSIQTNAIQTIEQEVRLSTGENRIRVVVENEDGAIAESVKRIVYNVEVTDRTDYALIFAVNDYDEWNDLQNPVFDGKAIEDELSTYYGFKTELVLNPNKRTILEKLREYAGKSYRPKDQLLIFFAGHGQFDEVTRMGYLVATDSKVDDMVGDTYISHSAFRDYANNIPSEHIFVVLDACFGGTFDQTLALAGSRGRDAFYELTQTEFIERKLKHKTRRYLTSGGKEYVPDGRPGSHSPFARKFLEALRNYGGEDKIITFTEMMTYFEALDPQPRSGEFGSNAPGSDFIFVSN